MKILHDIYVPFENGNSIYWRRGVKYLCLGAKFKGNEMILLCKNLDVPDSLVEKLPLDNTSEFKGDIHLEYLESVFKIGSTYSDVDGNKVVIVSYMILTNAEGRYEPGIVYNKGLVNELLGVRGVASFVKKFGFSPTNLAECNTM